MHNRFQGTPDEWRSGFARFYSDAAKVGLHEAKRVAELVHVNLAMLPPRDAAALIALHPDLDAMVRADPARDPRGAPPA